jgi:hypothetical protein
MVQPDVLLERIDNELRNLVVASLRLSESGARLDDEIKKRVRRRDFSGLNEPTTKATEYLLYLKEKIEEMKK